MKSLRLLFSFLLVGVLISCTDNDEQLQLTVLKLKTNINTTNIPVNKTVVFHLTGDNYINYTDQMTLYVDGQSVDGNSYTFTQTGEVQVQAKADNVSSNTLTFEVTQGMTVDRKSLLKNQKATFTLYDVATGDDITGQGNFYVNGQPMNGNVFSSAEEGTYLVHAEYTDADGNPQTSATDTLHVVVPTQRATIEDYTGTWCGYCPRMQAHINDLLEVTNNAVIIELHASSSDIDPDPYEYENIDQLVDEYNAYHQFPLGQIDRTITWNNGDIDQALSYMGGESPIGIATTTRVNGTQLNVDVRIASTQGLNNLKIVVAALENHLFHDQTNYLNSDPNSAWYQAGDPIPHYENDHVLRHAMTNIFGDPIPGTDALEDYTQTYSMDMADYFSDPNNAEVVVMVLDNTGKVVQAKKVGLNQKSEFE